MITERHEFKDGRYAWGKLLEMTGSLSDTVGEKNPLRYRGYYYDTETNLYYLQSRYYDPETCRFISADSLLVAGDAISGTNMFAYCLNNPVMYEDPSGKEVNIDTSNPLVALMTIIACTYICLNQNEGLGMTLDTYLLFLDECNSLGDAYYISQVMLCGKNQGINKDGDPYIFKINNRVVIIGAEFDECKSFTSKKVCMIVSRYFTWVDGGMSEISVAQEIYGHAMIYYNYNNVKKILPESLKEGLNISTEMINLGGDDFLRDKVFLPEMFNAIWYLSVGI